ncbi:creatininase family protein [Candidatus Parcubacteria bacterium]|nr:MAG: creatininase family protein [Candidatus Parcubacteria bacterium]
MLISELRSSDLKSGKKYTFLVSLGSLEQHGPYAPLGTDTYIQNALLKEVESHIPEVIFLPTIPISDSTLQLGFPGSITLASDTVYSILRDIVNSIRDYANLIFFVSWHGGNKPIIDTFIQETQPEYSSIHLVHITFGDEKTDELVESILGGPPDDHAGNTEISLMQFIKPECTGIPDNNSPKQYITYDWKKPLIQVFPDGVVDPHPGWVVSAEIGHKLIKIFSDNLIKKIQDSYLKNK